MTETLSDWGELLDLVDGAPSPEDLDRYAKRLARVVNLTGSAEKVTEILRSRNAELVGLGEHFLIRPRFMHQVVAATLGADWSDRKAPPREDRPSATRIMSGRGAALRFYLTAIAEAQIRLGPGKKADNPIPVRHDDEEIVS